MFHKNIDQNSHTARASLKKVFFGAIVLAMLFALCPLAVNAEAQSVQIGIPVEENPELFLNRSMPTHGEGKIAVFLIDFPDYRNENPMATVEYYDGVYFSGGVETRW